MKQTIVFLLLSINCFSQTAIPSFNLNVSYQKTTNLIFPYGIIKADIGSADVIGHLDEKLENVLFVKANLKNFSPTNLSIYTTDGKFYFFDVRYNENPDTLNLSFMPEPKIEVPINQAMLDSDASKIINEPSFLNRSIEDQDIKLKLKGIYLTENQIWFRLELRNYTQVTYRIESLRFYVRDKNQTKRTARQELEKEPVWYSSQKMLFGFPLFTIDRSKQLIIQLRETNGGRNLSLKIPAKLLLKSKFISQSKN
jgi:conjugative transposon TraN protein